MISTLKPIVVLCLLSPAGIAAAGPAASPIVTMRAMRFTGGSEREDSMWSALYGAKSGKLYIGLSTHAEAAHFFEFDPAADRMHHVADLTAFKGERGEGVRTSGKIHVRMGEDAEGRIYFGDFCEDTGPECVDPASYRGPHWFRYDPGEKRLENLGRINRQWGLLGFVLEPKYQRLYGLAEDGHLYAHDLRRGATRDLGRVDDWDICRTIFADDDGNIYGSFPIGRIWKYDPARDRVLDLRSVRLPMDPRIAPRTMSNPMIDRKAYWRVIEWDPVERVAYGVMVGDSMLFKYDPRDGAEGKVTPLVRLCAARYADADPAVIPVATLAMAISGDRRIYYAPVVSVAFDYAGTSWDVADERKFTAKIAGEAVPPESALVEYDIASGRCRELGIMRTEDGRKVFGLGGACVGQKDGRVYFVGAVEERDPARAANRIDNRWPFSMALLSYTPEVASVRRPRRWRRRRGRPQRPGPWRDAMDTGTSWPHRSVLRTAQVTLAPFEAVGTRTTQRDFAQSRTALKAAVELPHSKRAFAPPVGRRLHLVLLGLLCMGAQPVRAQKWVNPNFDAHRLDCRDLGYPDVTAIEADNSPITALLSDPRGRIYGATSGKTASYLFLYDRAINKVRPLGTIGDARGVHHALVQDADGTLLVGGGLNMLEPVSLTREFPGGFRAIEEQLWKDISAPYTNYGGGHLYRYEPAKHDAGTRMPGEACPLQDLGVPARGNTIYALAIGAKARRLYGITYPDARLFRWDLAENRATDLGALLERKVYSGPERAWRSVPRALHIAGDGRVYTSGEDGRIVYHDPETRAIVRTGMQIPGEYYEPWNYHGYPVIESWLAAPGGAVFGATSDGFLFRMDPAKEELTNLGKPRLSRRVRAMTAGPDGRLYMICGEFEEPCKLMSCGLDGSEGFRDWGVLAVDRSPYYAKRAYQFDAMATGVDGTIFIGESDRRASLFLFFPGATRFEGGLNPSNPR